MLNLPATLLMKRVLPQTPILKINKQTTAHYPHVLQSINNGLRQNVLSTERCFATDVKQTAANPDAILEANKIPKNLSSSEHVGALTKRNKDLLVFPRNLYPNLTEQEADELYKSVFKKLELPEQRKVWYWSLIGVYTKGRVMEKSASVLYESTNWHTENKDFYELYGIEPNFMGWFSVTLLHVWMVQVRLRLAGVTGIRFSQFYFNMFWQDTESRITGMGITNPMILGRELKRLARMYFGSTLAYDEGLLKGDAMLADALWRDLFHCKEVDPSVLSAVLKYVRRELQQLDKLEDEDIVFKGYVQWGRPIKPE